MSARRAAVLLPLLLAALWLPAALAQPASASTRAASAAPEGLGSLPGGTPRCRFAVPAGWAAPQVRWTGDCRDGLAHGLGALRWLQGNRVQQTFYGRLQRGQPVLGAIELEGGFKAGRFEQGALLPDAERNTLIQAFEEAGAAARAVAQHFQSRGNPASARYYRGKAEQLGQQMD